MSFDRLRSGSVIRYPFLWVREFDKGETEGRKSRPTAVGFRLNRPDGQDILILFPITTQQPKSNRFAVEIPDTEKKRAGLEAALRLWIILDEYNEDVIGQSFYLEPDSLIGEFSRAFFVPVVRAFIKRRSEVRGVNRR